MITIEIVVLDVRSVAEVGKYAVEMTIDGAHKTFVFGISPKSDKFVSYEDSFEEAFSNVLGARRIASLVTDFHRGKEVALPTAFQAFILEQGDKPPSFR